MFVDVFVVCGWEVWCVKIVVDVLNFVKVNCLYVGIVDFGSFVLFDVVLFEMLLCDLCVGWVVFVDGEWLCNIMIVWLICYCCFDYVCNVVVYMMIGYFVGYVYGMFEFVDGDLVVEVVLFDGVMIGVCGVMCWLFVMICKVVNIDVSVFIVGEFGIGKELMVVVIYW